MIVIRAVAVIAGLPLAVWFVIRVIEYIEERYDL